MALLVNNPGLVCVYCTPPLMRNAFFNGCCCFSDRIAALHCLEKNGGNFRD